MNEPGKATRDAVLDPIRLANPRVDPSLRVAEYAGLPRDYDQSSAMDHESLLALFCERLREYDAVVHESRQGEVSSTIDTMLTAYGHRSFIVADAFPTHWLPRETELPAESQADIEAMDRCDGALVSCEVAIAHTGTIILRGSRRLTLLPDRLLCVIRHDQIVETVPQAFARLQQFAAEPLTFISGPSATADIEMTRIRGVHGPRILGVILVRYDDFGTRFTCASSRF